MTNSEPPPSQTDIKIGGNVGGDVVTGDLTKNTTAGRDVVGRDVVYNQNTTNVGFTPAAVQRLIITVGMLVFVTAACFFSGGVVVGGAALAALQKSGNSENISAAQRFQNTVATIQQAPANQNFTFRFTEEEMSSYFRLVVGPQVGVSEGKVRLLDVTRGEMVLGGQLDRMGGLPFAVTVEMQGTPGAPMRIKAAAVQVLRLGDSAFGWVVVPGGLLQGVVDDFNAVFSNAAFTEVSAVGTSGPTAGPTWVLEGVTR